MTDKKNATAGLAPAIAQTSSGIPSDSPPESHQETTSGTARPKVGSTAVHTRGGRLGHPNPQRPVGLLEALEEEAICLGGRATTGATSWRSSAPAR